MDAISASLGVLGTLSATSIGALVTLWVKHSSAIDQLQRKASEDRLSSVHDARTKYEFDARTRLYTAVGPLRFQLLMACRDFSERVKGHVEGNSYALSLSAYYAQSFLFRLLRVLCICELIERKMHSADFAVDEDARQLLRFGRSIRFALAGRDLARNHPAANWDLQKQHIFYDAVANAANAIVIADAAGERPRRFGEFVELISTEEGRATLHPFPEIIEGFTPSSKPLFWLRMICVAHLCNDHVNAFGAAPGVSTREFDIRAAALKAEDAHITKHLEAFCDSCASIQQRSL